MRGIGIRPDEAIHMIAINALRPPDVSVGMLHLDLAAIPVPILPTADTADSVFDADIESLKGRLVFERMPKQKDMTGFYW